MSTECSPAPVDERERAAMLAAFEIGRLLNELRHHMIWAWCCHDRNHARRVVNCFDALAPRIRRADSSEFSDQAVRTIDEEKENWQANFGSEEHAEAICFAKSRLIRLGEFQNASPPREAHAVLTDFLAPVMAVDLILSRAVADCCRDRLRHFVTMGRELDEELHSPDLPCPSVTIQTTTQNVDSLRQHGGGWDSGLLDLREAAHAPYVDFVPRPASWSQRRYENLTNSWGLTGLPGRPLSPLVTIEDAEIVAAFVRQFDAEVRRTIERWGLCPQWDSERSELRVGAKVVRKIPARSKNLIKMLAAFQECGWQCRVDSPFQKNDGTLHETIRTMNEGLQLIVFHADGAGTGIAWEWQAQD